MHRVVLFFIMLAGMTYGSQAQKSDILLVDWTGKESHAYREILLKDAVVLIDSLPQRMIIIFPDGDLNAYSLVFNEKKSIKLSFACEGKETLCIPINVSDFDRNKLLLTFSDGKLIGIGSRLLQQAISIDRNEKKQYYIKLITPGKPATETSTIASHGTNVSNLCASLSSDTTQIALAVSLAIKKYNFLCAHYERKTGKDTCCKIIPTDYSVMFPTSCLDSNGHAVSVKYRWVYDARNGTITFLKLKHEKKKNGKLGYDYYTVQLGLHPRAGRQMIASVIGYKDSTYLFDVVTTQNFMEYEQAFAEALSGLATKPVTSASDTVQKSTGNPVPGSAEDKNKSSKEQAVDLKLKIESLKMDLQEFNNLLYPNIDLNEDQYNKDKFCLQKNIVDYFGLPGIPADGKKLMTELIAKLADIQGARHYVADLCPVITAVAVEYDIAVNKTAIYKIVSKPLEVPDADNFDLHVKYKGADNDFYKQTFKVSGGFKIDFSTGVFLTGITNTDFVTGKQLFRFKETRDFVSSTGGDSSVYTGALKDTSITVIQSNKKLTFGTGLLMHCYSRTGRWYNIGGASGIMLDNEGQAQILLGASIMLGNGKNRLSLTGGLTIGREKKLSSDFEQYYWSGHIKEYNRSRDLPFSFTGTNPTTYYSWTHSWFIGITYNFASLTVGKKGT